MDREQQKSKTPPIDVADAFFARRPDGTFEGFLVSTSGREVPWYRFDTFVDAEEWLRDFMRQIAEAAEAKKIVETAPIQDRRGWMQNAYVDEVIMWQRARSACTRLQHRGGPAKRPRAQGRRQREASARAGPDDPSEPEPPQPGGDSDGLTAFQAALVPALRLTRTELLALADHCTRRGLWLEGARLEEAA